MSLDDYIMGINDPDAPFNRKPKCDYCGDLLDENSDEQMKSQLCESCASKFWLKKSEGE